MTRYIATVEFQDGNYWISFPGIEKTYRLAKTPADIVPQALSRDSWLCQRNDRTLAVQISDCLVNGPIEFCDASECLVS